MVKPLKWCINWSNLSPKEKFLMGAPFIVSGVLKSEGIWPSDIFLPEDPADVSFSPYFDLTDTWDFLPFCLYVVEKRFGIKMDDDFSDSDGRISSLLPTCN